MDYPRINYSRYVRVWTGCIVSGGVISLGGLGLLYKGIVDDDITATQCGIGTLISGMGSNYISFTFRKEAIRHREEITSLDSIVTPDTTISKGRSLL